MSFDFKKYIPTNFKFPKNPDEDFAKVTVNKNRYQELLKQHQENPEKVSKERLEKFRARWMENEEDRFRRWEQQFHQQDLEKKLLRDYSTFKDNPKEYLKRALDLGSRGQGMFSKWWWTKPPRPAGKGKMTQSPLTGRWRQDYKPHRSRRIRDWLKAAEEGDVFTGSLNPNRIPIKRNETTKEERHQHHEATQKRALMKWRWLLKESNFLGSKDDRKRKLMWDDPISGFEGIMDENH